MRFFVLVSSIFTLLAVPTFSAEVPANYEPDFSPRPAVKALSPEEELKTIQLPEGYALELVLSERDGITEPVAIAFDGNGRMYVAQMSTYMQDVDGKGGMERKSIVTRHESTKGDGRFDKHTVYRDQMLLPRMVLPLDDRVLINETGTNDIFAYRDTDGDGKAEDKQMWFAGAPRGVNLEQQQSGLMWALDNWIYQTANTYRLRWNGTKPPLQEKIPSSGGQWGLAQDNYGKLWWSNAGNEKGLWHFQTPIIYGAYDVPGQFPADFLEVWPLVGKGDFQGGPSRVRPADLTVNHFTAVGGQEVVRVDRLPADLRGNVLLPEPAGRLVRRAKVDMQDGITTLTNPHGKSEFIRSSDPNFRVVNIANGPDGCLYLVDMYRGVIQEGNGTKEGSYLRKVILQHGMDKVTGKGRIWRLVHKDFKPGPQPKMLTETPAQWVTYLDHANGWWRDTAQKLLVMKGDKSVVPSLTYMATRGRTPLGRIHALWTLEGLGAAQVDLVRAMMMDADPQIRVQAIRVAEVLMQKGSTALMWDIQKRATDAEASVVLQALMSGKLLAAANKWPEYAKFAQTTVLTSSSKGVKTLGAVLLTGTENAGGRDYTKEQNAALEKGQAIYREQCASCHGMDGNGTPGRTMIPPLGGSETVRLHPDAMVNVLLSGLSGPVAGQTYGEQMPPMANYHDEGIAAVSSYVLNAFGNRGTIIQSSEVARLRKEAQKRKGPWTLDSLRVALPKVLPSDKQWVYTASANSAGLALTYDSNFTTRWDTRAEQAPGQWFQVELPEETALGGVRLEYAGWANDYPRGYKLETSLDGQKWVKLAEGKGTPGATNILFASTKAKFLKITQTGSVKTLYWTIAEIELFAPTFTVK